MASASFTLNPALTAIAVAYKQADLIADLVLPRVSVAADKFTYYKYDLADAFRNPETRVGRLSAPKTLDWSAMEVTDSVNDYALDAPVPNRDIKLYQDAVAAGLTKTRDPFATATRLLMQTVKNRREYRAAQLVHGAANYGTNNKVTLSGTGQWSDFTNSDPINAIKTKLKDMVMRPNIGVIGADVEHYLTLHPKTITTLYGSASTRGVATLEDIARVLGLDAIYVGRAWINTAQDGQSANLQRAWGKHAAFLYRDMEATPEGGVTFGFTAQWGEAIGGTYEDPKIGALGGTAVRAGEFVKELVTANDLGYLFTNAVA